MDCFKCGSLIKEGDKFCGKCGGELKGEAVLFKIIETVSNEVERLGANTRIGLSNHKVASVAVPEESIFNKEEVDTIVQIATEAAGTGNALKLFMYAGYLTRRHESHPLNGNIPKDKKEYVFKSLGIDSASSPKEAIKRISSWLDISETLSFGENAVPFLYQKKETINSILVDVINKTRVLNVLYSYLTIKNGVSSEVTLRNIFYGYCLRIAFEIYNSK